MKKHLLLLFAFGFTMCQLFAQQITITNNTGEAIISKQTAVVPSIASGEPFNYQITFQNLNQSNTLSITDLLPTGLCYNASDISADNSFIDFNGNPVPNPNSIPGLIDTSSFPTVAFSIPNNVQRGSFTITVRFCPGVTPNGFTVENNICAEYGPGGPTNENFCSTTGLTSTASALNPWGEISKEPLFPAIAGTGGDFFIPTSNGMANYKIRVEKDSQYQSSTFGMLNLQNPTISEIFPPCAVITLISGPGTLDPATNNIILTNDLQGNIPFESAEFIVSVDFTACTLVDGQVVSNTVSLNGTPVGEPIINGISTATADVIAVDILPPPVGSSVLVKSVQISNPVEGCQGMYIMQFENTDNRPISNIEITDVLPNNITPQSLIITGSINSASINNNFDIEINSGAPTTFPLTTGYNQNPWATTNNGFFLKANVNTELYPGDILQINIPFLVNTPNPIGSTITNCATLDATIIDIPNSINLPLNNTSCAPFVMETPQIKLCVDKGVRRAFTNDLFIDQLVNVVPTDEIEFEICIQNNGSIDFSGQLVDVLDSKYQFITVVSDNFPPGTTFTQSGQTLTWAAINLFQQCDTFNVIAGCANPFNQVFCAVIRVRVLQLTPPGNIDNAATLSGSGISETSEFAKVNVTQASVLRIVNEVSTDQVTWTNFVTLDPVCENEVFHRMTITNLGNQTLQNHQIIDELPAPGDIYFPSTLSRNSTFSLATINTTSAPDYMAEYINTVPSSTTPAQNFDCTTAPSGSPTPTAATKSIVYSSLGTLIPGASSTINIESTIPNAQTINTGDIARNSFYLVDCTGSNGGIIIPSNITSIDILSSLDLCTPLDLEPYADAVPAIASQAVADEVSEPLSGKDKEYGDFDNDGDMDILYTKQNPTSFSPELHVLINTAGPGVQPIYNIPGVNLGVDFCYSHRLYDWNNDGFNDVVVYGHNAGLYVFINNQTGGLNTNPITLLQGTVNFTYTDEVLIAVGDLSNDGLPDVLLSSQSIEIPGTVYFENQGGNVLTLPAPQVWVPGLGINTPFIPENSGSYPTPELYDADCDGDLDLLLSDPLLPGPPFGGGRMYFHENNGGVTSNTLPDVNITGVDNQFGFIDDVGSGSDLACDWLITRFADYLQDSCPIAIAYNPCNDRFFYYDRECVTCDNPLSINEFETPLPDSQIVLYPNPSNEAIHLVGKQLEAFNYQIISVNGSILSKNVSNAGAAISISDLASGLYFIKITTNKNQTTVKRFLKL